MASVELLWKLPLSDVTFTEDEARVWGFELDQPPSCIGDLFQILSRDEMGRAAQFKHDQMRCRYVVARATLRRLLGEALKLDPSAIAFKYSLQGKPELAGEFAGKLFFNVSHSRGLALIAITRICPLGVDLEQVRPLRYDIQIARRFFTPRESAKLESLPEVERPAAFCSLWTRKEAWLKAKGSGIADSLNRVDISFLPGEPPRILNVADEPGEAEQWALIELTPAKGFTGALAIRAAGVRVFCQRFPS